LKMRGRTETKTAMDSRLKLWRCHRGVNVISANIRCWRVSAAGACPPRLVNEFGDVVSKLLAASDSVFVLGHVVVRHEPAHICVMSGQTEGWGAEALGCRAVWHGGRRGAAGGERGQRGGGAGRAGE